MAVGVIGGSGLYNLEGLEQIERLQLDTPYGAPSNPYIKGVLHGTEMIFLPRHGEGHKLLPSEINFRANIWGFKKLGCERLISVSAVGSMREDVRPGDLVLVDQFIDWTRQRPMSFMGDGLVGHVALADPISLPLSKRLFEIASELDGITAHLGGTYICIEGPQFSTRAESKLYKSWGVDVIGMTNMPEARLAREAEICYATIALATDYDSWNEDEAHVETEAVLKILSDNVEKAKRVITRYAQGPIEPLDPLASKALHGALMTPETTISSDVRTRLEPVLKDVLSQES